MNLLKSKPYSKEQGNLTKLERLGIFELVNNPNLVIKKADKGSAVVAMQTKDYLCKVYKQLSDREFYIKLKEDPHTEIYSKRYAKCSLK